MDAPMYLPHGRYITISSGSGPQPSPIITSSKWISHHSSLKEEDNDTLVDDDEEDEEYDDYKNNHVWKPIVQRKQQPICTQPVIYLSDIISSYMTLIQQSVDKTRHQTEAFIIIPGRKWMNVLYTNTYHTVHQVPSTASHIIHDTVGNVSGRMEGVKTGVNITIGSVISSIQKRTSGGINAGRQHIDNIKSTISRTITKARDYMQTEWPWAVFYLCIIVSYLLSIFNDFVDNLLLPYIPFQPSKYYLRDALLARLPIYEMIRARDVFRGASTKSLSKIHVLSNNETSPRLAISFSGCSWLILYHAGVGMTLQKRFRPEILEYAEYLGSSSGTLIAAGMALGMDLENLVEIMITSASEQHQRFLGPVGVMSRNIEEGMRREISIDDETLCQRLNGRLTISLTRFPGFTNELRNEYTGRSNLVDCVLASSYFPIYWEKPISMTQSSYEYADETGEIIYIDGGFTNNQPFLSKTTITVSPHPGEANISPSTPFPLVWSLFPPSDEAILRKIVEQGQMDANAWLNQKLEDGVLSSFLFK